MKKAFLIIGGIIILVVIIAVIGDGKKEFSPSQFEEQVAEVSKPLTESLQQPIEESQEQTQLSTTDREEPIKEEKQKFEEIETPKSEPKTEKPACEPLQEVCDVIDNDCDGLVDENLTKQCGTSNVGVCKFGTKTCQNGKWGECIGAVNPTNEICDQKDNNCDGSIDEDLTRNTTCGVGACLGNTGYETCSAGTWGNDTCDLYANAAVETCDNIDNDCDGLVDEGNICVEPTEPNSETIIENHCQSEWPTDAQMKSYCKKQQYDGLATLNQGKPFDISDSQFNIIRNHCKSEWPTDFQMRAYCEKQQYDGVRTLNQGKPSDILNSEFSIIRTHCESEWPTDFQMRAYCEKQQYDGVRTLNQGKPAGVSESDFNSIRSSCANEWPTDFQMRAYCEKQKF